VQILEDVFVPRGHLDAVSGRLRDGDVIEFVREGRPWHYVGHIGLILHDEEGEVTLIHATSPAVREEPLAAYVKRHENVAGFKFLRLSDEGREDDMKEPEAADQSD
jgi:hypothetical protein